MFVEGEVEIKVKDRATAAMDDHDLKLWLQRGFKSMSCYRISSFQKEQGGILRAVVAVKTDDLPQNERHLIETHPHDVVLLRSFIERMFDGKGSCRAVGDPQLKTS
jgi:hypothetical protein